MHWSDRIAEQLIELKPNKEEYVCAAGISPSGAVHIGNFRDVATSYYVVEALQKKGKKARLLFSWDEYDRLRKVPSNVSQIADGYEKYIGMPYSSVPDPYGKGASYADYNEKTFERSLSELNIFPDYRYQTREYNSGRYSDKIIFALKKRKEIYDVLLSYKTQEPSKEERDNYYPINIYCDGCNKDNTEVVTLSDDCTELAFKCKACGQTKKVKIGEYNNIKLVWKVDWPMRWLVEGVDFEPGGIDHAASSGSYVVASDIARKIFGFEPPLFQGYGWLAIAGLGDMHSSTGNNVIPDTLLKIYEPEMIRWLFAKYEPKTPFAFNFDDTIIRHYSEFDKGVEEFFSGNSDEYNKTVIELALLEGYEAKVSFGVLASVATVVDFKPDALKRLLAKIGIEFTSNDESRLIRVKNWITEYQPSKMYRLLKSKNDNYYLHCSKEEKQSVKKLFEYIKSTESFTDKDIQLYIYSIINDENLTKKENMQRQQKFFKTFYNLLFGFDEGPRLYLFLAAADKNDYLMLLDF